MNFIKAREAFLAIVRETLESGEDQETIQKSCLETVQFMASMPCNPAKDLSAQKELSILVSQLLQAGIDVRIALPGGDA